MDAALAAEQGMEGARGVGSGAGRARGRVNWQSESIADDLWREFMLLHPDFDGKLTGAYMRPQ